MRIVVHLEREIKTKKRTYKKCVTELVNTQSELGDFEPYTNTCVR